MAISIHNVQQMLQDVPETSWVSREIDGTGVAVRWLQIACHTNHSRAHNYGICNSGDWTWQYSDDRRIASPENLSGFLPLLEETRTIAVSLLRSGVAARGLPSPVVLTFPLDKIVAMALQSSTYWRSLAEKWIDTEYPPNDEIAALVSENAKIRAWKRSRLRRVFEME